MRTRSVVTNPTVVARSWGVSALSGRPQSSIFPAETEPSPARARSRVLLPVPLRPIRAVSSPCPNEAETSSSSVRLP